MTQTEHIYRLLQRTMTVYTHLYRSLSKIYPKLKIFDNFEKEKRNGQYGYYVTPSIWHIYRTMELLKASSIIDLGCGCGFLLQTLRTVGGFAVKGIEIDKNLVELGREMMGPCIHQGDITEVTKRQIEGYQIIYFWDPFIPDSKGRKKMKKMLEALKTAMSQKQVIIYRGGMHRQLLEELGFITKNLRDGLTVYKVSRES